MGAAIIIILIDFVLCNFICRSLLVQPLTMVHLNWNNIWMTLQIKMAHTTKPSNISLLQEMTFMLYDSMEFHGLFLQSRKKLQVTGGTHQKPKFLIIFLLVWNNKHTKKLASHSEMTSKQTKGKTQHTQKQTVNLMCTVQHSVHSVWMCQ